MIESCAGCSDTKDGAADDSGNADFEQTMSVADSLFNCMQFRDAYDLYLQLLNNPVAEADSEKKLNVLSSISNASELSGHKVEETKWLQQQLDLAKETGNNYFHAMALVSMGQNIFFEGNRAKGIQYVNEAISLMGKTDRGNTDHLPHSFLNLLASLYGEMKDYDNSLKTNERNLQLTMQGTHWEPVQNQQLIDRRMALAKMAALLARMGIYSSGSKQRAYFQRADSAYAAWKAVEYEGNHTRDYFIVDYMKRRGLYHEAAAIYADLIQRIRQQGDTLGEMMNTAKWGLADVCQQMGRYQQAADLYEQVLVIQDTLKSRKARNTAQELAAVYQAKEQEQKIMEQEAKNTRLEAYIIIILLALIGVAALAFVFIVKNRIIRRKNHALVKLIDENIKLKRQGVNTSADNSKDRGDHSILPGKEAEGEDISLFARLSTDIREQQLYLDPSFDRQAVCDRFLLTPVQVGNAFAQSSDYSSVSDFIRDCRLEHACQLLKTTDMKIAEVASCSGFSRVTTFNHDFKTRYNLSPTEYRKR